MASGCDRARGLFAELDGACGKLAAKSFFRGDQFLAELDARLTKRLAQPKERGGVVAVRGEDPPPFIGVVSGGEAILPARSRKRPEDRVAQRVRAPAEPGNRLDHKIESRAEIFEDRANPVHRF